MGIILNKPTNQKTSWDVNQMNTNMDRFIHNKIGNNISPPIIDTKYQTYNQFNNLLLCNGHPFNTLNLTIIGEHHNFNKNFDHPICNMAIWGEKIGMGNI
jgi:hypothetical protein